MLGSAFLREARVAVPPAWGEATVRAALATVNHIVNRRGRLGGGQGIDSGGAQNHVAPEAHIGVSHSPGCRPDRLGGVGRPGLARQEAPKAATARPAPAGPRKAETAVAQPQPGSADAAGTFPVRGRVLDPDGKPVAGAGVYVRHYAEVQWLPIDPMAARQKGRVAVTDADGRFHFELDKAAGDIPSSGEISWHEAQIAAAAPGFAPAWVEAADLVEGRRGDAAASPRRRARPRAHRGFARAASRRGGCANPSDLGGQGRARPRHDAGLRRGGSKTRLAHGTGSIRGLRPGKRIRRRSGRAAGTPGQPAPTVSSRFGASAATESPGWTSTAAEWPTARST